MGSMSLTAQTAGFAWAPEESSPAHARHALRTTLADWGVDEDSIADAELLVTELVTNAVLHPRRALAGGSPITTSLWLTGTTLRVEVTDADPRLPVRCHPAATDEGLRGIALVEAFSREWGAEPLPGGAGKTVWWSQRVGFRY